MRKGRPDPILGKCAKVLGSCPILRAAGIMHVITPDAATDFVPLHKIMVEILNPAHSLNHQHQLLFQHLNQCRPLSTQSSPYATTFNNRI